jgi:hypothetical protein
MSWEPREPCEKKTAKILGAITLVLLGVSLLVSMLTSSETPTALCWLATSVFFLFFLWSVFRLPT